LIMLDQPIADPAFVQDPYAFYDRARAAGPFFRWSALPMPCTGDAAIVNAILRDRRFGREVPAELIRPVPPHLAPFYAVEAHSMLEAEPPRHTRLRGLVLRAFTSRRIAGLGPEIAALSHRLIDAAPSGPFDLLAHFAQRLPILVITRLLGVPEAMADPILRWSHAMVAMYPQGRTRATEDAAVAATEAFAAWLTGHIETRRTTPADDLITHLIAAVDDGDRLTTDEMIATCILLLNAGHEATVHAIGNAVRALLIHDTPIAALGPDAIAATVEEVLRFDPPLHLFTRHCTTEAVIAGHTFRRGDEVGLLLAMANRDPAVWPDPQRFDPFRAPAPHASFGAGLHFCVGAPLARLELATALPILFARLPGLRLAAPPLYAPTWHFHGLASLPVARD